jgi:hypothetical protein
MTDVGAESAGLLRGVFRIQRMARPVCKGFVEIGS